MVQEILPLAGTIVEVEAYKSPTKDPNGYPRRWCPPFPGRLSYFGWPKGARCCCARSGRQSSWTAKVIHNITCIPFDILLLLPFLPDRVLQAVSCKQVKHAADSVRSSRQLPSTHRRSTRANTSSTQPSSSNHFRPGASRTRFIHHRSRPTLPGTMAFLDRLMRLGTAPGLCLKACLEGLRDEHGAFGAGFLTRMDLCHFAPSPRNLHE